MIEFNFILNFLYLKLCLLDEIWIELEIFFVEMTIGFRGDGIATVLDIFLEIFRIEFLNFGELKDFTKIFIDLDFFIIRI